MLTRLLTFEEFKIILSNFINIINTRIDMKIILLLWMAVRPFVQVLLHFWV